MLIFRFLGLINVESSLLDGLVPDDVVVCVLLGGEVHGQDGDVRGEGPEVQTVHRHHVEDPQQIGVDGVVVDG